MEELGENYENISETLDHRPKFDTIQVLTESVSATWDKYETIRWRGSGLNNLCFSSDIILVIKPWIKRACSTHGSGKN
jgi:hypothetical protein